MTTVSVWLLSLLGLSSFLSLWLFYRFVRGEHRLARFEEEARASRESLSLLKQRHDEVVKDRRQTEDKLREYLQLLDTLINTIPNPIYFKDADGVYRGCNRAFSKEVLGLSRDQIIGRRNQELGSRMPLDLASVVKSMKTRSPTAGGCTPLKPRSLVPTDGRGCFTSGSLPSTTTTDRGQAALGSWWI